MARARANGSRVSSATRACAEGRAARLDRFALVHREVVAEEAVRVDLGLDRAQARERRGREGLGDPLGAQRACRSSGTCPSACAASVRPRRVEAVGVRAHARRPRSSPSGARTPSRPRRRRRPRRRPRGAGRSRTSPASSIRAAAAANAGVTCSMSPDRECGSPAPCCGPRSAFAMTRAYVVSCTDCCTSGASSANGCSRAMIVSGSPESTIAVELRDLRLARAAAAHEQERRQVARRRLHDRGRSPRGTRRRRRPRTRAAPSRPRRPRRPRTRTLVTMPTFAPAPRIAQNSSGRVLGIRPHDRAVGEHDLGRAQVVDREAVLAREEADAARGREAADADAAVVARA